MGSNLHSFRHAGDAGGKQLCGALYFHEAKPASPNVAEAIEVTERRDGKPGGAGGFKDGLVGARGHVRAVDAKSLDFSSRRAHELASTPDEHSHTPAGHRFFSM